ncbi:hypothetical protein LSH36_378g02053 [Paralvinella palmiformis]|uniref:Nephrocystin 3-like N-terminal domain-containing protein n=1 Tax=Paralvinella palmiformis TaxID=53620 RepID=A0AAD9JDE9_9ANNE|nr:hypothetical protein LSH36_378g02053 [Paralvinella palmiformis]
MLRFSFSASSIKYTPTTTTSSLRRASSGRDAAAAGKAKEVHRRQSGVSCTVKERDDSHPVVPRKGDIRKLLCDFTDEVKGVVASYEFCPNTRSRLMNPIQKWIAGEETDKDSVERVWLLTGQAGMGKSAVTAEVYRKNGSRLVVGHFFKCNHPNLDYNDARFVLQSLARQLCGVVPDYAAALSRCTQLEATIEDGGAIIDLNEAFDVLFRQPLFSIELNRSTTDRVLVVLDAVDECRPDTRNQLLKLINSFAEKTPDWLYLLVTSRNENQILSQLENARTVEMKLTGDNLADIKKFLKQPMSKHMDRISLDGGLTQLVKKTDGNFLCAKVLSGMLDQLSPEKSIALREIESMFPKGTINCYAAVFKSFKDGLGKFVSPNELNDKYQSIAGLLCSAREPIPIDMLAETVKVDADCLDGLRPVLDVGDGCFALRNRHTADWLRNEQESGDLHVNISAGQKRLANWCLALLNHIGNRTENKYPVALQRYALKHAIWHLVEMPKQQENIAGLLCELRYISEKLQIPSVKARHLLHDYEHSHQTCFGESRKLISMADYMKKQPKLMQQMAAYHRFVRNQRKNLDDNPKSALNIAANYPSCDRIQQNALVELEGSPWLEDKSVVAETQHTAVRHPGLIEGADLSSDGKTVALMVASDERSCRLVMMNTITGEKKTADLDAKTIGDRLGSCVRFLADDSAIFVGSLSTFINPRQASPVPSGIDVKSVQMKEKYAIESCCVSRKFIVCGLSTLPTGGRSLHLAVLDLKAKKCTRLIEALKFRFGGSTQFGIKSCALSQDDALICSLVKETPRAQFVCTLWTISTGTSLYKVNMYGEYLTKCVFIGNDSILVGSGLKSYIRQENAEPTERTKLWNFKAGHQVVDWDEHEICSAFCIYNSGYLRLKWYFHGSRAYLETWKGKNVSAEAAERYRIDGVNSVCDVMAASDHLVVLTKEDIRLYNLCNLTQIQREENNAMTTSDVQIANMTWHPRREELVLAHISPDVQDQGVSTLNLHSDELTLSPAPVKLTAVGVKKDQGTPKVFHGRVTKTDACQYSSDGSMVVVKNGQSMVIWDIGNDKSDVLVSNDNSQDDGQLECVTSQKDNIVGVVRPDKPDTVQVFDLKSRHMIRQFSVPDAEAPVSDFLFLPYNGYLVAYYGKMAGTLVVWNPRNGEMVHQQPELDVSYIRLSPASDRLAINGGGDRTGGRLVLRSSDNKIRITLRIPDSWSGSPESSDAEFVADGTVLVGVAAEANVCRIWNAANGDVLRDWTIDFRWPVELIGAVTNAHVLLRDDRLMVVDIVTGQIVTSLSLVENLVRKTDRLGLRISPKGNTIVGSTKYGHLKILQCHNYGAVKRKSTLQIMKSSNK